MTSPSTPDPARDPNSPTPPPPPGDQQQGAQQAPPPHPGAQPGYPTAPPAPYAASAPLSPSDEKMWALAAHLSPFVVGFLGPLVIYLVFKDRGPFVRHQSAQALNFQIILTIGMVVSFILTFVIIGIFTMLALLVWFVVAAILGAIEANKGNWYRYPLTPEFVK